MMKTRALVGLLFACGCGESSPAEPAPEVITCGSAGATLPEGLTAISWDDGRPVSDLTRQSWSVAGVALNGAHLFEGVRFDVAGPAKIYGFSIHWSSLAPELGPKTEIPAALYPDFGYNGFEFWHEPLWQGSRCREDITTDLPTFYVLPEPITLSHSGLIYVAHERQSQLIPSFALDASRNGAGDCALFADCHSVVNLPDADPASYYAGVSSPLPYDFLVRLYVEYTEPVPPPSPYFEVAAGAPAIGGRQSWGDYDNDGYDDLLAAPALLHNDGGVFTDVTALSGLSGASMSGGVWGDYDNDGCLDLFVFSEATTAGDSLWRSNCDGTFTDVTALSGISDVQSYNLCQNDPLQDHQPSPAAAWWDIDNDGLLDLYVVGFICWADWDFYRDQVFRNNGDGTFADWTATRGFSNEAFSGRGAAPIDYDQDGDVDLLVNDYTLQQNLFFANNGDGTVSEAGLANGLAGVETRHQGALYYGHTIGVAWGDLDNDGDFDVIEANLAHPRFFDFSNKTMVLLNDGTGMFTDRAGTWQEPVSAAGLRYQETHSVPVLADFDRDGRLDLAISAVYDGRPTDFYWGSGDGTFRLDADRAGIDVTNGWGMAVSDFDNDGDVDLAATGWLFANQVDASGSWLEVRAVGNVLSNRGAYGATVRLTAAGVTYLRHVQGGSGQGNQDSAYLHFGLGNATEVTSIQVDFPGGGTITYAGPFAVGQRVWVYEDGHAGVGWGPPG